MQTIRRCIAAWAVVLGMLGGAPTTAQEPAEWLFMVYLDGDNNLDPFGLLDVQEMERTGSTDQLKVVVLMDRLGGGKDEWSTTRRFLVQKLPPEGSVRSWDTNQTTCVDLGELNMGDPKTLTEFVQWAVKEYPAKKRALVLWNHGGGWRDVYARAVARSSKTSRLERGIAWDDTNGGDFLEMREVRQALESSNQKLDLIGADACLMGMLEVAYELRERAGFLVASEDLEPGPGWDYVRALGLLQASPALPARDFSALLAREYHLSYGTNEATTCSAIQLDAVQPLAEALDRLAGEMIPLLGEAGAKEKLRLKNNKVPGYPAKPREFLDLGGLLEWLGTNVTGKARESVASARSALASAVVTNLSSSVLGGTGLSIYPGEGGDDADYRDDIILFAKDTRWDDMLRTMHSPAPVAGGPTSAADAAVEKWAVIIAVKDYKDPQIMDLAYPVKDATALRAALTQKGGYAEDHVKLLLDADATAASVRTTLGTWLPRQVSEKDMVLIYFSGHGGAEPSVDGKSEDGTEKYLILSDSKLEDMYGTALPMSELSKIFGRIRSNKILLVLDACYSGATGARGVMRAGMKSVGLSDRYLDALAASQGTVVLTASQANEVSMESPTLEHGVFTYHFLRVIEGKADTDGDGMTSLAEAYGLLSREVPDAAKAMGASQHPVMKGEMTGAFPLVATPKSALTTTMVVPPPPPANTPPKEAAGPPVVPAAKAGLILLTPRGTAGGVMKVRITGFPEPGRDRNAWIGLYDRPGASDKEYIHYTFLSNLRGNTWEVDLPDTPGKYHVRLFPDHGYERIAISDEFPVE